MPKKSTVTTAAVIVALCGSITAIVQLGSKVLDLKQEAKKQEQALQDQKKTLAAHATTMTVQAKTIQDQEKTIQQITYNGLTPAGTFHDGLMNSLTNFFQSQTQQHPANLIVITDFASYGCVSHPAEYDVLNGSIEALAKPGESKTVVTMLLFSDKYAKEIMEKQYPQNAWQAKIAGKSDTDQSKNLARWFNRADVRKAIKTLKIPAARELAFRDGIFASDDRDLFIQCSAAYNAYMKEYFMDHGVSVLSYEHPLPFHLWMTGQVPQDQTISGIISIADWISSVDEPGFQIRKLTYNQINAIATQIVREGAPYVVQTKQTQIEHTVRLHPTVSNGVDGFVQK